MTHYPPPSHRKDATPWETPPGAIVPTSSAPLDQWATDFEAMRQAVQAQPLALRPVAPPPIPQPAPQAQPPVYHAPHYAAPTFQAPQYGAYSPVFKPTIVVTTQAESRSAQDNSAGGWWPLAFLTLFLLPFAAVITGGD